MATTMASNDILPATLDFLTDAGHLLAFSAPETSAYLMSQRNGLLFENEVPQTDIQRMHVCTCCGNILLPGHGTELKLEHRKAVQKRRSANGKSKQQQQQRPDDKSRTGPAKILTCGHCARTTKVQFPAPARVSRRARNAPKAVPSAAGKACASTAAQPAQNAPPPPKATANASSKKRAKSRKVGLQALLDQQSSKSKSGLGLSLADFMSR